MASLGTRVQPSNRNHRKSLHSQFQPHIQKETSRLLKQHHHMAGIHNNGAICWVLIPATDVVRGAYTLVASISRIAP